MGPFIIGPKILFSTSGKLPYTFFFFTFQNIPFYTNSISHTHMPTFNMCIPPIWIPPLCLFLITISLCKNILAQNIKTNTIGKLDIPKQLIKVTWLSLQHICMT
jgi:hypothetical protein